ncbi:MAG: AAA family ATPase [Chamaesiphon sp. CSU_1_12]|nr:AAA family ATPase [Chamaesiphon sp. CSU_1_12]
MKKAISMLYRKQKPQCCIQAEESILGGILLDPNALTRIRDRLKPVHFYIPTHGTIYQAALDLATRQQTTDLLSLEYYLEDCGLLAEIGGMSKLVQLLERTVCTANIDKFATLVIDKYQRRQSIEAGERIATIASDPIATLESIYQRSTEIVRDLTKQGIDSSRSNTIAIEDALKGILDGNEAAYKVGLKAIDCQGGLRGRDLIIVAARTGFGKSWMGIYLSMQIARTTQLPIVFFSAEMSREQLTKRFLANCSEVENNRLINNTFTATERKKLTKAAQTLAKLPIIIDDTNASNLTAAKIRTILDRITDERGQIGLVVVDYIQKLGDRGSGHRHGVIGQLCGEFKDIAKEYNLPFVTLAKSNAAIPKNVRPYRTLPTQMISVAMPI